MPAHYLTLRATIDKYDTVTIEGTNNASTFDLKVPKGIDLADDIAATLNVDQGNVYRDTYAVLTNDRGCVVKVGDGTFMIPWQRITDVVAQLRA